LFFLVPEALKGNWRFVYQQKDGFLMLTGIVLVIAALVDTAITWMRNMAWKNYQIEHRARLKQ